VRKYGFSFHSTCFSAVAALVDRDSKKRAKRAGGTKIGPIWPLVAKRRDRGEGSISGPNSDGVYEVAISLGVDVDGKRRRVKARVRGTRADARAKLDELRQTHALVRRARRYQRSTVTLRRGSHGAGRPSRRQRSERTPARSRTCAAHRPSPPRSIYRGPDRNGDAIARRPQAHDPRRR